METFRSSPKTAPSPVETTSTPRISPPREQPPARPQKLRVDPFGGAVPRDENAQVKKKSAELAASLEASQSRRMSPHPGNPEGGDRSEEGPGQKS